MSRFQGAVGMAGLTSGARSLRRAMVAELLSVVPARQAHTGRHRLTLREPPMPDAPKSLRLEEAARLGRLPTDVTLLEDRPVPATPHEHQRNLHNYKRAMKAVRGTYRAEVDGRAAREQEARLRLYWRLQAEREGRRVKNDRRKLVRRMRHEERMRRREAVFGARRDLQRRVTGVRAKQRSHKLQAWLDALEQDSANWVTEDRVDELITEDLFKDRYPWQFEAYFEAKAMYELAQEQRARAERLEAETKGQPTGAAAKELEELAQSIARAEANWLSYQQDSWQDGKPDEELQFRFDSFNPVEGARSTGLQLEDLYSGVDAEERRRRRQVALGNYARKYLSDEAEEVREWRAAQARGDTEDLAAAGAETEPAEGTPDWIQDGQNSQGIDEAWLRGFRQQQAEAGMTWLTDAQGAPIADEGRDEAEEDAIAAARRSGLPDALARTLARKQARVERNHPHVVAAMRERGYSAEQAGKLAGARGEGEGYLAWESQAARQARLDRERRQVDDGEANEAADEAEADK